MGTTRDSFRGGVWWWGVACVHTYVRWGVRLYVGCVCGVGGGVCAGAKG